MSDNFKDNDIFKTIFRKKIMTIDELSTLLNSSVKTARRRLKLWNAYTSYNENARYYTLPGIPEFDVHGLWVYKHVRFSQYGNLTQTVIHIVKHSPSGLDAAELTEILGIPVRSLLTALHSHPELTREKLQGRFVYFSALEHESSSQKTSRRRMPRSLQLPSAHEAMAILVATLNHPHLSAEELALRLRAPHDTISPQSILNLWSYHGVTRKKMSNSPA